MVDVSCILTHWHKCQHMYVAVPQDAGLVHITQAKGAACGCDTGCDIDTRGHQRLQYTYRIETYACMMHNSPCPRMHLRASR